MTTLAAPSQATGSLRASLLAPCGMHQVVFRSSCFYELP